MQRVLRNRVERLKLQLQAIESRNVLRRPMSLVDDRRQRCDELAERASRAIRLKCERLNQKMAMLAGTLHALSPLKVLSRGYSLTTAEDESVVASIKQVAPGIEIRTQVGDGLIWSTVSDTKPSGLNN